MTVEGEHWTLDPEDDPLRMPGDDSSEVDVSGTAARAAGINLMEQEMAPPAAKAPAQGIAPPDVLADAFWEPREVRLKCRVFSVDPTGMSGTVALLEEKCQKMTREGGSLRRVSAQGWAIYFDVLQASIDTPGDFGFVTWDRAVVEMRFRCKPFFRRAADTRSLHTENTLPVLTFTETLVDGSVPALARLIVNEAEGHDQFTAIWGMRSWGYSADPTARLYYTADELTPVSGATSFDGSIIAADLTEEWVAAVSTRLSDDGSAMSHVGGYEVWVRVQRSGAAGDIGLRLEWGQGDGLIVERNEPVVLPDELGGEPMLVPLGIVRLDRVPEGDQRWEGRVLVNDSEAGDSLVFNWMAFFPTERGGIASAMQGSEVPSVFTSRDSFRQSAGDLEGEALWVGGTWANQMGSDGFSVDEDRRAAFRDTTDDAAFHLDQIAYDDSTGDTEGFVAEVQVQASKYVGPDHPRLALVGRIVDESNYFAVAFIPSRDKGDAFFRAFIVLGGTRYNLFTLRERHKLKRKKRKRFKKHPHPTAKMDLRLMIDRQGRWTAWLNKSGADSKDPIAQGYHFELATGGALESGFVGIGDINRDSGGVKRWYKKFFVADLTPDAAVFANQSMEVRHDGVIRTDPDGEVWPPATDYQGDLLQVPPAGPETRTAEFIVKLTRGDPDLLGADLSTDNLSGQLVLYPRGIQVPPLDS